MGCCYSVEWNEDEEDGEIVGSLHDNLLRQRKSDVFEHYEIVQRLGEGSMGAVSRVRVKESKIGGSAYQPKAKRCVPWCLRRKADVVSERRAVNVEYALKTIILDRISQQFIDELKNEVRLLKELDHPNIVKAYEVFETGKYIYLILELCAGGDLFKRVPYSEKQSVRIVESLCSAVRYMHDRGIVHRDLKFENIMFESHSRDAEIKIIDFGLSKKFLPEERFMTEGVGTIYTMAPQVLQGVYTSQADLWSIGVITYMLLASQKPFYHRRRRRVIDRIMRADYNFKAPIWKVISDEAKDFVTKLLVIDPEERLNASQALEHPWLSSNATYSLETPSQSDLQDMADSILQFKDSSELKKVALNIIAHKSSTEEIMALREVFSKYDTSNDGEIQFSEFKEALKSCNFSDELLAEIFSSIDVNHNGVIAYTEFLAATIEARHNIEEERIAEAFDRIDSDDTGFISRENLRDILGKDATNERIDRMIKEADENNDGKISFQEFLKVFRRDTAELAAEMEGNEASALSESVANLVGLDAVIPGGKYDKSKVAS